MAVDRPPTDDTVTGGLVDKGTKGKRARTVPYMKWSPAGWIVPRTATHACSPGRAAGASPPLFYAMQRSGTASSRTSATRTFGVTTCDTGLTWLADAGVPVHVLRKIAGHGSLTTTQRYLHPDRRHIDDAGQALSAHLTARRSPSGPQLRVV